MKNGNQGFTLIEVIVAIAIISLVSGGLITMFSTSAKVNRRAKEIDMANLIAVSDTEKIKRRPDKFIDEASDVKREDLGDTKVITATSEKYLDYQWNEVSNKSDSTFTVKTTVEKVEESGDYSIYRPKHGDDDKYELCKTNTSSLIVAIDEEGSSDKYKAFILEKTYDEFINEILAEELAKKDNDDYGYIKALREVLQDYGVEYREDSGETGKLGAIPMYLNVKEHGRTDTYSIEVYNLSKRQIDLYLTEVQDIKDNIEFSIISGTASVTYLSGDKDKNSGYSFNVQITRNKDDSQLIDYSTKGNKGH